LFAFVCVVTLPVPVTFPFGGLLTFTLFTLRCLRCRLPAVYVVSRYTLPHVGLFGLVRSPVARCYVPGSHTPVWLRNVAAFTLFVYVVTFLVGYAFAVG